MAVDLLEPTATMTISSEERAFFVTLGERIASLRRANNTTQVQLAEALGLEAHFAARFPHFRTPELAWA